MSHLIGDIACSSSRILDSLASDLKLNVATHICEVIGGWWSTTPAVTDRSEEGFFCFYSICRVISSSCCHIYFGGASLVCYSSSSLDERAEKYIGESVCI